MTDPQSDDYEERAAIVLDRLLAEGYDLDKDRDLIEDTILGEIGHPPRPNKEAC